MTGKARVSTCRVGGVIQRLVLTLSCCTLTAANKKARLFAPPSSYDDPPSGSFSGSGPSFRPATDSAPFASSFTPAEVVPNKSAVAREETGEEAYQRRLALSAGGASRQAPPAPPASYPGFAPSSAPAVPLFRAQQPPPPPPTLRPPPGFRPSSSDFFSAGSPTPPPPPPGFIPPPFMQPGQAPGGYGQPGVATGPSFVSASSQAGAGPTPSSAVNDAAAKAREIAARLSKLAGLMPSMPSAGDSSTPPAANAAPAPASTE